MLTIFYINICEKSRGMPNYADFTYEFAFAIEKD